MNDNNDNNMITTSISTSSTSISLSSTTLTTSSTTILEVNVKRQYRYNAIVKELQDPVPSARHLYTTCRQVLWGIVESINESNNENDIEDNDDIYDNDEMKDLLLPVQFGSKKNKRRKKKTRINNEFPIMDNIYMVMYDGDNMFYPAEVIGVGPSNPPLSTCIIKFIRHGNVCEVKRSTGLIQVPIHYQDAIDNDLMTCYDFDKPDDVHEKYWDQRYRLLSRYDEGIQLDAESWFSITPEIIAKHIAQRCLEQFKKNNKTINTVLDCFSGCGGNTIPLADICNIVIAVDIDPKKILKLVHNSQIYNASEHIYPICEDVYNVLKSFQADQNLQNKVDIIILSPPWGGVDYSKQKFNIKDFPSGNGVELIEKALAICSNVVCIFPRNCVNKQMKDLSKKFNTTCYLEEIQLYGKSKMKIIYFGEILFV